METLKPTSIRLPQSLKKRLDRACLDRDVTKQDAVIVAIEQWVNGPAVAPSTSPAPVEASNRPPYRKENSRWHAIVEAVLNDPSQAQAMQMLLEGAELRLNEKRRRPAGRLANGE